MWNYFIPDTGFQTRKYFKSSSQSYGWNYSDIFIDIIKIKLCNQSLEFDALNFNRYISGSTNTQIAFIYLTFVHNLNNIKIKILKI